MAKVKLKIKKGDKVIVITGSHKGSTGVVSKVLPEAMRVVVENVNMAVRHKKPTTRNPQGGRVSEAMPIHYSNVMIVDPKTDLATRVGFKVMADGKKVRVSRRSGELID